MTVVRERKCGVSVRSQSPDIAGISLPVLLCKVTEVRVDYNHEHE